MRVRLLGTAAGGGLPQWNCACDGCARARAAGVNRTQDCVAVSGDGRAWFLLNASPDLRTQLAAAPELAPGPGRRDTPLRGVLLSTAELDHTLGLLTLREASALTLYGSSCVLDALAGPFPVRPLLARYTTLHCAAVGGGEIDLDGGLRARALTVGSKRPRYAEGLPGDDWVLAYRVHDPHTGGVLVYAPCLPAWSSAFEELTADAGCVVLDGTFLHDDELRRSTGGGGTATSMGHLPIEVSEPLLPRRPATRYMYTHLNNTNPAAVAGTTPRSAAEVPADGASFEL
ncbi:pyrroloquinoline quinone biosynthesis protein PqqB [Dactylosporangium sp. CA-139066]|uniref:pyrroloquinoline quinone biosynthesis protein PqqB n=1 Tax=Dactylosporangium sp. CA-139066 TaxID=3239930 RepID=UPI003D8ED91F